VAPDARRAGLVATRRVGAPRRALGTGAPPIADPNPVEEVLVQVIDVLDDPVVDRSAHGDLVEHRYILHVFAQADAAGVRADRDLDRAAIAATRKARLSSTAVIGSTYTRSSPDRRAR
jgi:hypothetical protein